MTSPNQVLNPPAPSGAPTAPSAHQDLPVISRTMLQEIWQRFRRHCLALYSTLVLLILIAVCFTVPLFVSENQANQLTLTRMKQPPSLTHPFSTDDIGRDMLLRTIFADRNLRIALH